MFQTKNQLRREIRRLEAELSEAKNDLKCKVMIETADLPKCKSKACFSCKHIVFRHSPFNSHTVYLVGCGKDLDCPDFTPDSTNKLPVDQCLEALQKDLQVLSPL